MVNIKGGSKHKKYAKQKAEPVKLDIRSLKKDDEGQTYGFITDNLGNCRFNVECWDGVKRLAHIRGKLKKRCWCNKGDLVLIGLRDFQDDKCDIISKYTEEQVQFLIKKNEISELFGKEGNSNSLAVDENNATFINNSDSEDDERELYVSNLPEEVPIWELDSNSGESSDLDIDNI